MKAGLYLLGCLIIAAGLLGLSMGNGLPLLSAITGCLLSATAKRWLASQSLLPGFVLAMLIFLSGVPALGGPATGLLVSAALAIFFLTWLQCLRLNYDTGLLLRTHPLFFSSAAGLHTASFYATLLLAFLCLQGRDLPFHHIFCLFIAAGFLMLGLAAWECGRHSRLRTTPQAGNVAATDRLSRYCIIVLLFLATFLLFRLPLPWMAERSIELLADQSNPNQRLNLPGAEPPSRSGEPGLDPPAFGDGPQAGTDTVPVPDELLEHSVSGLPTQPRGLPRRADIRLDNTVRVLLTIDDPQATERQRNHQLYVRAYGAGLYDQGVWRPYLGPGKLLTDRSDGRADGKITLKEEVPGALPHTIYYYHYNKSALLSFPEPSSFKVDTLTAFGDGYHTVDHVGNLTYSAVAKPLLFEELPQRRLKAGQAHRIYTQRAGGVLWRDINATILEPMELRRRSLADQLSLLKKHFAETYRYSEKIENPNDREPLENFLFYEKAGYCRFFAHAGALMLRELGIPSRMAYGYAGGLYDSTHQVFAFVGADAHAWTEIYLEDFGWVVYDLTPEEQGARHLPEVTPIASGQNPVARFLRATEAGEEVAKQNQENRLSHYSQFAHRWTPPNLAFLAYLDALLLILALALLSVYILRKLRSTNPQDDEDLQYQVKHPPPPGYFTDFCQLFAEAGYPRSEGETLKEYFVILQRARLFGDEFDKLLSYHYRTRYEGSKRKQDLERTFQRQIREYGRRNGAKAE